MSSFRQETKLPVYFTLDAGPNIHLMYPASVKEQVKAFIDSQLVPLCEGGQFIEDNAGKGPIES